MALGAENQGMSKFPDGNFTIVNNETGRCVRVRLGKTKDVSDYREGTKYLQHVTTKPTLELGIPDNSPATAWWFSTINDGVERQPFNQIVNFAVDEYQNIGRYCVWMYTDSLSNNDDRAHSQEVYLNKLNNAPADLRAKLDALIPDEWNTWYAERNSRMVEHWKEAPQERLRVKITAEMEAWAADEEPLGAEKLAQLKAIREREIEHIEAQQRRDEEADRLRRRRKAPEPFDETAGLSEEDRALLEEIRLRPRAARIRSRTKELLPAVKERRNKDLELKWQRLLPVATLESWHRHCTVLGFYADGGIRLSGDYETPWTRGWRQRSASTWKRLPRKASSRQCWASPAHGRRCTAAVPAGAAAAPTGGCTTAPTSTARTARPSPRSGPTGPTKTAAWLARTRAARARPGLSPPGSRPPRPPTRYAPSHLPASSAPSALSSACNPGPSHPAGLRAGPQPAWGDAARRV